MPRRADAALSRRIIGAVAEAVLLCEKSGVDPARVMQALAGGAADAARAEALAARFSARDARLVPPKGKYEW